MFKVTRGTTRSVVSVPLLGIVLKFPRIKIHDSIYILKIGIKHRALFKNRHAVVSVIAANLGRGITANMRERHYYKYSVFPFRLLLQPTYFSLLGLINVQKYGRPAGSDRSDMGTRIYRKFFAVAGQNLVLDGHLWANASNFHINQGVVKLLDYGNEKTQEIIDRFGYEMLKSVDLSDLV